MNALQTRRALEPRDYFSWIAFWVQFALLAAVAIFGAVFASEGGEPGDYVSGLWLAGAAIALGFMRLKQYFDAGPVDWPTFLLVEDWINLVAVIVVFVIVGLGGLFLAAGSPSLSLHDAGLALFAASGLAVFLSLKRVFDKLEGRR
jgi:hypothetical protein